MQLIVKKHIDACFDRSPTNFEEFNSCSSKVLRKLKDQNLALGGINAFLHIRYEKCMLSKKSEKVCQQETQTELREAFEKLKKEYRNLK